jgi:hypothetical protein
MAVAGVSKRDEVVLRRPPHSVEAEQSVLGALLLEAAAWVRIDDVLESQAFYVHEHRLIFDAIGQQVRAGSVVDVVTVFEALQASGQDFGGLAYLNQLAQSVPGASAIRQYAMIVAERQTMREIIAFSDEIATAAFNPGNRTALALLERAHEQVARLCNKRGGGTQQRVPLLSLDALKTAAQSVRWLVKHVMPADSIGMLFGGSGTFKSFIALDAGLHVAHGLPWMGRKTNKGPVIYIAAEGGAGLWPRINAWHRARNLSPADAAVHVVPVALDLTVDAWRVVEAAQLAGVQPLMVVVDTLSQTYSGEENSANEMAAYLRELGARFRALWSCTVLLIHHSGHQATERPRGSSAIRANVDFLLGVFRDEREMMATVSCVKQKDGELFDDAMFSLAVRELGVDDDGDKITSLVARHLGTLDDVQAAIEAEASAGRAGRQHVFMSLVQSGMAEKELRKLFYDTLPDLDAEARRKAYGRARKLAEQRGEMEVAQGFVIDLRKPKRGA